MTIDIEVKTTFFASPVSLGVQSNRWWDWHILNKVGLDNGKWARWYETILIYRKGKLRAMTNIFLMSSKSDKIFLVGLATGLYISI